MAREKTGLLIYHELCSTLDASKVLLLHYGSQSWKVRQSVFSSSNSLVVLLGLRYLDLILVEMQPLVGG